MIDGYTLFLLKRHEQRVSVNGLTIVPKYDKMGRNQGKTIHFGEDKLAEEHITYRKVGDHATNMQISGLVKILQTRRIFKSR